MYMLLFLVVHIVGVSEYLDCYANSHWFIDNSGPDTASLGIIKKFFDKVLRELISMMEIVTFHKKNNNKFSGGIQTPAPVGKLNDTLLICQNLL